MATFDRLKQITGSVVDRPLEDQVADLEKYAAEEPDNPAPLLMAAVVVSVARDNHLKVDEYKAEARERLLDADPSNPETAFALALYRVLEPELELYELAHDLEDPERKKKGKNAAARSAKANAELAKAAKTVNDPFADVVTSAVQTLSWGHSIKGGPYKQGIKQLEKQAAAGDNRDLASFFLIYAHRRVRDYDAALKVAQDFETRQPNSSVLKKIIGSIHQFGGDADRAVEYYRQATILAPTDPSAYHGLTHALLAAARAADAQVEKYDRAGQFKPLRARLPF